MTRRLGRVAAATLGLATPALIALPAMGAEIYVQPSGFIGAETNSNLDLTPGGQGETTGYLADIGSVIGIASQNSATNIRPRLDYRDYPSDRQDNRLEEYLDFNSYYKGQRSSFGISGTLDHRDEFNAEQTSAQFDDFNPNQPTAPQTGRTTVGATRDSVYALPSYTYSLSPLLAVGVNALYQKVNYSPNDFSRFVDFDYYQGKLFVVWSVNQKSDLTFGAYGNKYNATRFDSKETAEGGSVDLNTSWTPLFSTKASVTAQRSDIESQIATSNGKVNAWGASLGATYKTEIQSVRGDLTRLITPSGGGSVYIVNQAHAQYDRRITQRFSVTTAAIYLDNRSLSPQTNSGDARDYLRTLVEMKWMITRTMYIQGGYQYTWQKYTTDPDGAANNRFYLRFGYQGLDRQW